MSTPPRATVLLAAAGALALAACGAKRAPYDPFRVPREQLAPALKVVALAPLEAPSDIEQPELVKSRFLATIEARLNEAGIAVIPPADVGPVLKAAMEWRGGFYDPKTGALDEAKLQGAREEALQNLAAKHGRVDALVLPDIRVVRAVLAEDTAYWSGTKEFAATTGWKAALGVSHSGNVRALSLVVRLTGARGEDLYVDSGGIRVLDKISMRGERVPVPATELFLDDGRNAKAVSLALDALVDAARRAATAPPPAATTGTAPTAPPRAADPPR
jgi:hypothetical protein